jgi:2-haloacid dehalogenase
MKAIKGIIFDLYGTLYDVHSVARHCSEHFPGRGLEISMIWRQKQLEYTWLRSLMGHYLPFEEATDDALRYTCAHLKLTLTDDVRARLCNEYLKIQPYPEVPAALAELQAMDLPLAILSNGSVRSIHSVVSHSGLEGRFAHLISVEHVKVFKPHPDVYALAENTMGLHGYPVCWVNRADSSFEELGQQPDHIVSRLDDLPLWLGHAVPR